MQQAVIVACSVKPGDSIKKGDQLYEIETDKATMDIESPVDGLVSRIFVEVGQTVGIDQPVMLLADKGEHIAQDLIDSLTEEAAPIAAAELPTPLPAASDVPVDPSAIKLGKTIPLTRKQIITAQKMLESKRRIPCFYLTATADVTEVVALREKLNQTAATKITYNDFIIRAVATALEKFPTMTGCLIADAVAMPDSINIALAIDLPDGVVAPVIKNVSRMSVAEIAAASAALVEKAQAGKLGPDDLEDACITISNLGAFGADRFIPIVVPGQCSILGVGRITDTLLPEETGHRHQDKPEIVVRKLMSMTLSVDHRIANGSYAARFLDFARKQLEDASNFK